MDEHLIQKKIATTRFSRAATVEVDDAGQVSLSFSSEAPVDRGYVVEILSHEPGAMVLDRAKNGLPFLVDHNTSQLAGRAENITIGVDRKGRANIRFGASELAREISADIQSGIRPDISVGYRILEYKITKGQGGAPDVLRATKWEPLEISSVPVPADYAVGIGRSIDAPDEDEDDEQEDSDKEDALAGSRSIPSPITAAPQPAGKKEVRMDEKDLAPDGVNQNNKRAAEILRLAMSHGFQERAAAWVESGRSVDSVANEILDEMAKRATAIPQPGSESIVNMNEKERKQYSYRRAILCAVEASEGKPFSGFEREISDEIQRNMPSSYKQKGGVFVPISTRAGLDSITPTAGAEGKFTEPGEFIDLLRNMAVVVKRGARVLTGLQGPVSFPKQTGSGTAYWMTENGGSNVAESNLTLGTVTIAPKTLQSTTSFSRQLLAQSVFDTESLVRTDLAEVHALAWDLAALHGSGADSQPMGIYNAPGVGSVAMGSVTPTFGKLVDMVTAIAVANAIMGNIGWVTTPSLAGKMMQTLVASAAGSDMIWKGTFEDGVLAGYGASATNQVSATLGSGADEHGIIVGNWNDLLIGQWGGMEILTDPYALKKQGMIEVTSFQMVDIALRRGASFTKGTAAKPA